MSGQMTTRTVLTTDLPLPGRRSGKVRDIYDVTLKDGRPGLLIVATDRISAFDVVMQNGLPGKGLVLTQLSQFWFQRVVSQPGEQSVQHHLISTRADDVAGLSDALRAAIDRRVMVCRKTRVVPVECIARGYLAGSGLKEYQRTGSVCGIPLPPGLRNGDRLPEPLFTPSTKAETGHDENISFAQAVELVGEPMMRWLRDASLTLYRDAAEYAAARGIILADTKFEFGVPEDADTSGGQFVPPMLIDEIFTPDSSRFWPADRWQPGQEQESFDKQFVRSYLETLVAAGTWDKTPPGPVLPDSVVDATMQRYREAYLRLTGSPIVLD